MPSSSPSVLLAFEHVGFGYAPGHHVLQDVGFALERGKNYAFVGPTGGGKSTLASLMDRLYDPTEGRILLSGQDIRSYETKELSARIGYILQEPILFTGTVGSNIRYGHPTLGEASDDELREALEQKGFGELMHLFREGLATVVEPGRDDLSLGQRQVVAFMRILLREPDLLILDEATANIDTVTEGILQRILDQMPEQITKVIIAHRLNTIRKADQIFFVNGGHVRKAEDFEEAIRLIDQSKRVT